MGAIGGLLGLNGGVNGTGFSGPGTTNVVNPTNTQQVQGAYTGAQNSLQAQQSLLQALQAQQGVNNQSQVYNQLQGVANGTGPNPAQATLNQATGADVANQAAMAAGQRGASSNVGLMNRQAAQAGAGIQQNAAGQAATMQANQSLNALSAAGSLANTQAANQIGQTNANVAGQQGEQAQLLGAQQGVNNANVGMQSNINNANAGLAGSTMGMTGAAIGGAAQGLGAAFAAQGGEIVSGPSSSFGQFLHGKNMKMGGMVKADGQDQKAVASGNSLSNDKIPAVLSEHEIVLPREVTMSKDPVKDSAKFVAAVLAKRKAGKK